VDTSQMNLSERFLRVRLDGRLTISGLPLVDLFSSDALALTT